MAGKDLVFRVEDLQSREVTTLVKNCAEVLERHFKGWLWGVQPELEHGQGIINIYSIRLSGEWGYTLKLKRVQEDPNLRCILVAGGEILERFGFRRVAYSIEEWRRREQVMGKFIPDVPDRSNFDIRRAEIHRIRGRNARIAAEAQAGKAIILTDPHIGAALKERGHVLQS